MRRCVDARLVLGAVFCVFGVVFVTKPKFIFGTEAEAEVGVMVNDQREELVRKRDREKGRGKGGKEGRKGRREKERIS